MSSFKEYRSKLREDAIMRHGHREEAIMSHGLPDSKISGGSEDVDDGRSENAGHLGSQTADFSQPENANDSESEKADGSEESSEKTNDSEGADNSDESSDDSDFEGEGLEDASEESEDDDQYEEWALWPSWNMNYAARMNLPGLEQGPAHVNANSLVWPPMLLVIAGLALEDNHKAVNVVRETLAKHGTEISAAEVVCWEGNQTYTLLTLPPTGVAFTAGKTADDFYHEHEGDEALPWCCYPSLRDMVDARNGRIPESTRGFVSGLRYQGKPSEEWKNLEVELVLDDGVHVGRCVCCEFVTELHVDVQVVDVAEDLVPLDWKDSVCRWKTKNVLYEGVSLFERLRQHRQSGTFVYFSEDCHVEADASDVQQNQGVLRDLVNLTTVELGSIVAPWFCSVKDDEALESLSSKLCGDEFQEIENPFRALPERDFGEQYVTGLIFEKQLQDYEETRMEQILAILSQASTEKVLMKRLGITNNISLAEDVVKRLETLHKLNESGKGSALVSKMIESARSMELSTLRSISEHVQLEKQWKHTLDEMERTGNETIHKFMEKQHQALLKMLLQIKDAQIAKIEEFVSQKFKLLNDIDRTRKETESVVGWLSKHTAKATYKVKRTHMIEKKLWETQAVASKAELEAARLEADKLAAMAQRRAEEIAKLEEQIENSKAVLQEREDHIRKQLDEQKKRELQFLRQQLEVEKMAELHIQQRRLDKEKKVELQAVQERLEEQSNSVVSCAVCFESLEGTFSKKRNRDGVILKRRSCFVPCMHANMCSKCSEEAWNKYKRCPVCNTSCPSKPKPIFVV